MTVQLRIGEALWEGWTAIAVRRSLEEMCAAFQLDLTERWPGQTTVRPIRAGQRCSLSLDGETVIEGYIDLAQVEYGRDTHRVRVAGRDLTGDLVDCSAAVRSWTGASLHRIANDLAEPFGISVTGDAPKPFLSFAVEPGETAFEALSRAAKLRGRLLYGDGLGGLTMVQPGRERSPVELRLGANLLELKGAVDYSDRYSTYTLLGQQPDPGSWVGPEGSSHVKESIDDPVFGARKRPWIQLGDQGLDGDDARTRIEYERSIRAANSIRLEAALQGWRETPGGPLWTPGRTIAVRDAWLGLDGREMLIAGVLLTLAADGTRTRLTLLPPDAYRPEPPEPEPAADDDKGWIP